MRIDLPKGILFWGGSLEVRIWLCLLTVVLSKLLGTGASFCSSKALHDLCVIDIIKNSAMKTDHWDELCSSDKLF